MNDILFGLTLLLPVSRVLLEPSKSMEPPTINSLSNTTHSHLWINNLSITYVSDTSAVPRQLAITLSRIANGFHLSRQDMSALRQWMISLPPHFVRVFFKTGLPILKPIWKSLVGVPGMNRHVKPTLVPSGSQENRALFRSLIEAGLQANDLIDRDSSKCIDTAIHFHCEDLIQPLIDYGVNIDGRDPCSRTADRGYRALLRCAVRASCPAALKALIKAGASVRSRYDAGHAYGTNYTALGSLIDGLNGRLAAQSDYKCLEALLAAGAQVRSRFHPNAIPTILDMAFLTKRDIFKRLLQYSSILVSPMTIHDTIIAAENGMVSLETYLNRTDFSNSKEERQRMLEYVLVISTSNVETTKVLLGRGVDVNASVELININDRGSPSVIIHCPLGSAVLLAAKIGLDRGAKEVISTLVHAGAIITHTILASSITESGFELLQFLVSMVNSVETIGSLALGRAVCLGNREAIGFLLSRGVSVNSTLKIPTLQDDTSCQVVQLALRGLDEYIPESPDGYLFEDHSWFRPASLDMVEYIIDLGADVNARGATSHASTLGYILDRCVSCNDLVKRFEVCLKYTIPSTIQKYWLDLMNRCVNPIRWQNRDNLNYRSTKRILMMLFRHDAYQPSVAALTLFILAGASRGIIKSALASVQHVNPDIGAPAIEFSGRTLDSRHFNSYYYGFSPLRASVCQGDMSLVLQLLQRGAQVNESPTALSFSPHSRSRSYEYKLTTLQTAIWATWGGAYLDEDEDGGGDRGEDEDEDQEEKPSRHIGRDKWLEIAQHLLEEGARVNASGGEGGLTALQIAAGSGDVRCCLLLISHGASLNDSSCTLAGITPEPFWKRDLMGDRIYPLDWAAWFGRLDVVQLLINLKAESVYQQLTRYDGAIQMAKEQGHTGVVDLLLLNVNGISLSEWGARFVDPGIWYIDRIL